MPSSRCSAAGTKATRRSAASRSDSGRGSRGILALVAFTPLSHIWFVHVSGLSPELADFAIPAARVLTPIPFLGVILSLQRGTLIRNRTTGPIIGATAAEIAAVAAVFVVVGWGLGWVGATAAFTGFLFGRLIANLYLTPKVRAARARAARP